MNVKVAKPAFLVNLGLAPLNWTPEIYQYRAFLNPSWLHSFWIGTVWNVALLPTRLWIEVIHMAFKGHIGMALYMLVIGIPYSMFMLAMAGIFGRLRAHGLPLDLVLQSEFMNEQQARDEIVNGPALMIRQHPKSVG